MKLLIATGNRHKVGEIRQILSVENLNIIGLDTIPDAPHVDEDGDTFEANAVKKAVSQARHANMWALADDSGISVKALNGAPGVRSARYAGETANDADNNRMLLDMMRSETDRTATFCCVMALAAPDGRVETVRGECHGHILSEERGINGFGYDPLFVPFGYTVTYAELDIAEKNRISHRARALSAACARWWPDERFTFPTID